MIERIRPGFDFSRAVKRVNDSNALWIAFALGAAGYGLYIADYSAAIAGVFLAWGFNRDAVAIYYRQKWFDAPLKLDAIRAYNDGYAKGSKDAAETTRRFS